MLNVFVSPKLHASYSLAIAHQVASIGSRLRSASCPRVFLAVRDQTLKLFIIYYSRVVAVVADCGQAHLSVLVVCACWLQFHDGAFAEHDACGDKASELPPALPTSIVLLPAVGDCECVPSAALAQLELLLNHHPTLQALVYSILPSTAAIVDYAIGLKKLSANEQLFDHAQTAVSL